MNGQACDDCPYAVEAPQTADGAAAWLAGSRCLAVSLGFGAMDMRIDWAAALAVASAEGCDPRAAPELLRAVADGLAKARAESGES